MFTLRQITRVDQQSDELTARTHRTILVIWIVIAVGLASSFAVALSVVQIEVVRVVLSFRGRIWDVAQGRLDQPVGNLDRPNEIGEMSRVLQTLQVSAREQATQGWIKSVVAGTTEQLQSVEDFPTFAISADDDGAKKKVEFLLAGFGYSVIDLGNLRDGGLIQQAGGPLAGRNLFEEGERQ
jgi:hypothetical protein